MAKRPNPDKVIYMARKRGLYTMYSGSGKDFKYEFWNRATGQWVLTFYVQRGFWTSPTGKGNATDLRDALRDGYDSVNQTTPS